MNKLVKELENNDSLFEDKFEKLDEYYVFDTKSSVYDFINENRALLVLLDEIKPYLEKYFDNAQYELCMCYNPQIKGTIHLVLFVYVSRERFFNGATSDMRTLNYEIIPLREEVDITSQFLITPGILH